MSVTPGGGAADEPTRWKRALPTIAWGIGFGLIPLMLVSLGIETALHFSDEPIDGPFQLYNALRRILAGQQGGVDFQFFHGIGIPYLAYIPFRLMGGTFAASELSRQLLATLAGPVVVLAVFRVFTGNWRRAFTLSTIVLALSIALGLRPMVLAINSLLSIRTALPTLIPALWILPIGRRWRSMLTGAAIGGSILLGTEQGLAVLAAFLIVSAVLVWRAPQRVPVILETAIALAAMVVTVTGVTLVIGGLAGMKGALYYNLKLVPMDQYWYFGSPPNVFLTGWNSVGRLMMDQPRIPAAILIGIVVVAYQLRRTWIESAVDADRRHAAITLLVLYGLIACASLLGIFLVSYVQPLIRALLIVGAMALDSWLQKRTTSKPARAQRAWLSLGTAATLSLLAMANAAPTMMRQFVITFPHVISAHVFGREGMRLEDYWPNTLAIGQRILDAHRGPDGKPPVVWSTYAGLLEARNGLFHPDVDYIIHVLGPANRAKYVEDFRAVRPALVQTVLPSFSQYEPWIEQTSWDFYAELLRNYRALEATPWSIFWERLPTPADSARVFWSSAVTAGARSVDVILPPAPTGRADAMLVQIELTYRVRNPLGKLPIVGALPRYIVTTSGAITPAPVTLDPYVTTTRFPLVALGGQRIRLAFATYSLLPGASLEVTGIRAAQIPITRGNFPWLRNLVEATASQRLPVSK
jgi:hypothetical protein